MTTPWLAEASALLETVLIDEVQMLLVGEKVTVGTRVTRPTTAVGDPIPALVQGTTLENAVESQTQQVFSIKVEQATLLEAGMAVEVVRCDREPHLRGKRLFIDKVSLNGMALIRKAVASDFDIVNQEGKVNI